MINTVKSLLKQIIPVKWRKQYHRMKRNKNIESFHPFTVERVYGDHLLKIYIGDPTGDAWYNHDAPLPPEIAFLKQHGLKSGSKVFDLGANQGVYAVILAKEVGEQGRVIAVEAIPYNAQVAATNREINRVPQLEILNAAAAENDGQIAFDDTDLNGHVDIATVDKSGGIAVQALCLDSLTRQYMQPDVLFIDVEGFEGAVLRGGPSTLLNRPLVFIEVHTGGALERYGDRLQNILSFFKPSVYQVYVAPPLDAPDGKPSPFVPMNQAPDQLFRSRFYLCAVPCE